MAGEFPVLEDLSKRLTSSLSFDRRCFTEVRESKIGIVLSEYRCIKYFGWSLTKASHVVIYNQPTSKTSQINDRCVGLDTFMATRNDLQGHFLLNVTGVIVTKHMISSKIVPDVFKHIHIRNNRQSYMTQFEVLTSEGRKVKIFGNIDSLGPLVMGVRYLLTNIQCTCGPEPYLGWVTKLSIAHALGYQHTEISYGISEVPQLARIDNMLVSSLIGEDRVISEYFLISARILKLIKLELFIDEKSSNLRPSDHQKLCSKLVMSMDDSSCGFLGIAYDHLAAYTLGINEKAWTQIGDLVADSGPLTITMRTDETESRLVRLLRKAFHHASLQNDRQMLVKVLPLSKYTHSMSARAVPFRACVDRERNQWATFHTKVHKSVTLKIINIRANMADAGLKSQFLTFCNFGVGAGGKSTLTDKNMTKMFKDCKIYGKSVTTTDTDIAFSKVKEKGKKEITFEEFKRLLNDLAPKYAKDHKLDPSNAFDAMVTAISGNGPSLAGTTGVSKTGGVERMTDHTQYTGSHKERFDEDGKGKGMDGRHNVTDNSGYVGNYKGAGTFDKTH